MKEDTQTERRGFAGAGNPCATQPSYVKSWTDPAHGVDLT
jgi:hypothetical protein